MPKKLKLTVIMSNVSLRRNLSGFMLLLSFFLLTWLLGRLFSLNIDTLRKPLTQIPIWLSATAYVALYVAVSFFLWASKDIFKVVGALCFGVYLSTLLVLIAELINASILFSMARRLGRDFVRRTLKGAGESLNGKIGRFGFWGIFSLRIIPLVPFRFLDILAGLTGLRLKDYLLAAALGSPLRIFWVQYILSAVGESVFKNPKILSVYLLENPFILGLSFVYLIAAVILAMVLSRKKDRTNG